MDDPQVLSATEEQPLSGFITIANFTRYIRWVADPNVADGPVITLDIVAKE